MVYKKEHQQAPTMVLICEVYNKPLENKTSNFCTNLVVVNVIQLQYKYTTMLHARSILPHTLCQTYMRHYKNDTHYEPYLSLSLSYSA